MTAQKTYRMFVPFEHNDRYFESSHTREEPRTMSYLMDVIRSDDTGTYQGVIFLLADLKEVERLADLALKMAGLTREEIQELVDLQ